MTPEEINKINQKNREKYKKGINKKIAKYCPKCQRTREVDEFTENCPFCKTRFKQSNDFNSLFSSNNTTTIKPKTNSYLVYKVIAIISIAVVAFLLFKACNGSSFDKNNHHDNICDNCGRTATVHMGNNIELCDDCANSFWDYLDDESKKNGY